MYDFQFKVVVPNSIHGRASRAPLLAIFSFVIAPLQTQWAWLPLSARDVSTHIHIHADTQAHSITHTHSHVHTHTHTHTRPHAHMHVNTHTHTYDNIRVRHQPFGSRQFRLRVICCHTPHLRPSYFIRYHLDVDISNGMVLCSLE